MSYSDDEIKIEEEVDDEDIDLGVDSELDDVLDDDLLVEDENDLLDDGFSEVSGPEY